MQESATTRVGAVMPFMRYTDANRAIEWLGEAFGFAASEVNIADDGTVAHAELLLDNGVIMLGQAGEAWLGLKSPADLGGVSQGIYVSVDDADAHHARAAAAGAEIVRELYDTPYGSREYAARDLDGHLWFFGTYRPK